MFENISIPAQIANLAKDQRIGAYYLRVSTEEQARAKADPLGRQSLNLSFIGEVLGAPAEKNIFIDKQSGRSDQRPSLQELTNKVAEREVHWVAIDRIDRIGRNIEHNMKLWRLFKDSEVQLFIFDWGRFVNFDDYSGSEDWDKFVNDSTNSERESRIKARRSHAAHRYSRHLKKANYIQPFGYKRTEDGRSVIDPETRAIALARIDCFFEAGSYRKACELLRERHDHHVSSKGLAGWLVNPVLRGHTPRTVDPNKRGVEQYSDIDWNTHPDEALISEVTYKKILLARRTGTGGKAGGTHKNPTPLAGLCECALCGHSLTVSRWKGKKHVNSYLACHGRRTRSPSSNCWQIPRDEWRSIRYEVVDQAVMDRLRSRAAELAQLVVEADAETDDQPSEQELTLRDQINRLERLDKELGGGKFTSEIVELKAKLTALNPGKKQPDLYLVQQLIDKFADEGKHPFLTRMTDNIKREFYALFVKKIVIDRNKIVSIELLV